MQGGGQRGATRSACAERRLLSRGRTPLSHLPDKHHENSAAHTVIAAPAAGRVSTSPFPRGESESEISPPPSSLRPPLAAAPAPAAPVPDALPGSANGPLPPSGRPLSAPRPRRPPGPCRHPSFPRRYPQPCQLLGTPPWPPKRLLDPPPPSALSASRFLLPPPFPRASSRGRTPLSP